MRRRRVENVPPKKGGKCAEKSKRKNERQKRGKCGEKVFFNRAELGGKSRSSFTLSQQVSVFFGWPCLLARSLFWGAGALSLVLLYDGVLSSDCCLVRDDIHHPPSRSLCHSSVAFSLFACLAFCLPAHFFSFNFRCFFRQASSPVRYAGMTHWPLLSREPLQVTRLFSREKNTPRVFYTTSS